MDTLQDVSVTVHTKYRQLRTYDSNAFLKHTTISRIRVSRRLNWLQIGARCRTFQGGNVPGHIEATDNKLKNQRVLQIV
jgi:hypothetical protein